MVNNNVQQNSIKRDTGRIQKVFVQQQWPNEKYKWEAVQCFQENWDINSADFAQMLKNLWLRLIICLGLQITFQKE